VIRIIFFFSEFLLSHDKRAQAFFREVEQLLGNRKLLLLSFDRGERAARQHDRVCALAHEQDLRAYPYNEAHAFARRVEGELREDLVAFFFVRQSIGNEGMSATIFLQNKSDLLGALEQGQLIGTRSLVAQLLGVRVDFNLNSITDSEQTKELISPCAYVR
jgi:hypothetical protein